MGLYLVNVIIILYIYIKYKIVTFPMHVDLTLFLFGILKKYSCYLKYRLIHIIILLQNI